MSAWTPERVAKLRVLWTQGLSCSQIARELNKLEGKSVSRNAVISKRDRAGLPKRAEPNRSYGPRKKQAPRVKAAPSSPRIPRIASTANEYGARRPPFISERPNAIAWSKHRDFTHCAMFCHGESGDSGFVCGNPARMGSVYCSECSRVSYVPGSSVAGAKVAA